MPEISILEWIGYLASVTVLVSLLMSSIIKLRWINLCGSIIFAIYGFLIGAIPVALLNIATIGINVYYLIKIYTFKEYFKKIAVDIKSKYFEYFLSFYKEEIERLFPGIILNFSENVFGFFVLRNMAASGVFLVSEIDRNTLFVHLDYVAPEYRDFKVGKFIFEQNLKYFTEKGYGKLLSKGYTPKHQEYLGKMGFVLNSENGIYEKVIER